jgi:pimeloyl-ACP methyl ester carboxylesterase
MAAHDDKESQMPPRIASDTVLVAKPNPAIHPSSQHPLSGTSLQGGVVLLHGIARTPRGFRQMQGTLEKSGFATLNLGYPSRHQPLEALAEAVHPSIARFAEQVEGPIHFVGHSMGGLLTRVYLAHYRPSRLGRVVMLGTPNRGSELADLFKNLKLYRAYLGPAGQQLTTERDQALKALLPPVDYPVGVIAGNRSVYPVASAFVLPRPNDGRVSVENTKLEGMTDHLVIGASHPWLTRSPIAIRQTVAFLRHGRFGALASGNHEATAGKAVQA